MAETTSAPSLTNLVLCVSLLVLVSCGVKEPEDTTPKPYTCSGTPATCLQISSGWAFEGIAATFDQSGSDPWIVRLDDGRYRLYERVIIDEPSAWDGMASWISTSGIGFQQEVGYRFQGYTLFQHCVVHNPDGSYRMYWCDQKQGWVNNLANKAIKSAISTDGGWTFSEEDGERLRYSGTGYEVNGIVSCRVLLLPNGSFRMYYHAYSDHDRILSSLSSDGLNFTREDGIRLDRLCPPETQFGGVTPVIDAQGSIHIFAQTVRCTGNYVNPQAGIFDGTTTDGLTINMAFLPVVQGYSKDGTMDNSVHPEDYVVLQTPEGLRLYFILYGAGKVVSETALYSVINRSIK